MENIRERVRRFLTEFTSPQEKDIQDFISYLAIDNPSLDRDSFRNSVLKSIEQRNTLKAYEKELLSLTRDSPFYAEIETILKEAKEGHDNLEDVEDELDNIKKILTSLTVTRNIEKPVEAEIPPVEKPVEITDGELEDIPGEIEEEEIPSVEGSLEALSTTPKKEDVQIPGGEKQKLSENADAFMRRLNLDDTKTLLKDHMTPEKQAVFELLEEKLMSDVETRIKKLKEMQTKVLEEEPTKTFFGKIKTFFTKETENIEAYDISLHGPLVTFEGLEGFNEIERYWVNEPYSFVVILFDPENNTHLYYAAEPVLTDFEELFLREIKERLKDVLLVETVQREEDKKKIITAKVIQLVRDYAIDITPLTLEKVLYYTRRDFIYFGKIDPLMHDNRIEDISSNGFDIP
ncbi:MAG: hypothetical protein KKD46_06895, partial [Euryarchaeota archaeon]|nr:hypothetical protein [Euryarchaeota archaeon]